jgi:transposase InsO family protein
MERVAMDILGPLPLSRKGNKYVLVISDLFTKWTESVALPNQEAKTVAEAFVNNFVCKFGVPLQLFTDQGSNFESRLLAEICAILGIEKTHTTSMRPQANGFVERFIKTLTSMLSAYCQNNQSDWDSSLPLVMLAYRSTPQSTTNVSPNKMVFGKEIILPMNAVVGHPKAERNTNHTKNILIY